MKKIELKDALAHINMVREKYLRLEYISPERINFDALIYQDPRDICDVNLFVECIKKFSSHSDMRTRSWADIVLRIFYSRYGDWKGLQEFMFLFRPWNHPGVIFVKGGLFIYLYDNNVFLPVFDGDIDEDNLVCREIIFLDIPWATLEKFPSYREDIENNREISIDHQYRESRSG